MPDLPPAEAPDRRCAAIHALKGAFIYELRMQARRPAVWVVLSLALALPVLAVTLPVHYAAGVTGASQVVNLAYHLQFPAGAIAGCLLADRLPRDRRLRVEGLLAALPATTGGRLLGKCLGAAAGTALPLVVAFTVGTAGLVAHFGPGILGTALGALAAVNLPGLLFVAAFSVGCPAVMAIPVYQFLFVGYWFWGHFMAPLGGSVLSPSGRFALRAFFGTPTPTPAWQGVVSLALLLGCAALALAVTAAHLDRQRAAA